MNCWIRATPCAGVARQRAVLLRDAVGDEASQCLVERLGLSERDLVGVERARQHAVEDHPPDPVGEQLGVLGTEVGSVALAQVVQLLVAEHRADDVHVTRSGLGVHVRGDLGRPRLAARTDQLRGRGQRIDLLGCVGRAVRGEERIEGGVVHAVHRVGAHHPTRVEPDHVERVGQVAGQHEPRGPGIVHRGHARPTRVDEQRTPGVLGGPDPGRLELQGSCTRIGVVDGDRDLRALEAVPASLPANLLTVESREVVSQGW